MRPMLGPTATTTAIARGALSALTMSEVRRAAVLRAQAGSGKAAPNCLGSLRRTNQRAPQPMMNAVTPLSGIATL